MARVLKRSLLAVSGLALLLAGCSSAPIVDELPASIGLPAGTPARPTTPYQYPAVHDIPPPRAAPTLSDEQQGQVEKELAAARDRQEAREGPAKKAGPAAKKKRAAAKNGGAAGSKDGAKDNP